MKERPILFNSEMVRAILDGRKTQTRRPVRPVGKRDCFVLLDYGSGWWPYQSEDGESSMLSDGNETPIACPYGAPGDRLWVRETISKPFPEDTKLKSFTGFYKATDQFRKVKWLPSIHMPRWASRLTLEITDVRVERVQEISEENAKAEGVESGYGRLIDSSPISSMWTAKDRFKSLWNSINAPRGFGWDANPWVWAIMFKKVEAS